MEKLNLVQDENYLFISNLGLLRHLGIALGDESPYHKQQYEDCDQGRDEQQQGKVIIHVSTLYCAFTNMLI